MSSPNLLSSQNPRDLLADRIHAVQILVAVLTFGAAAFLTVAFIIIQVQGPLVPPNGIPFQTIAAAVLGVILLVARFLVPDGWARWQRGKIVEGTWKPAAPTPGVAEFLKGTGDTGRFMMVFQTCTMLAAALLEGAAFLGGLAYLLEGTPAALGIAIFFIFLLAVQFPTRARIQDWIDEQMDEAERERQLKASEPPG